MDHLPHNPLLTVILTVTLFASSAMLGALEHADLIFSIIAKLAATGAGVASMYVAYRSLKTKK